jgi:hypothetical protein
LRCHSTHRRLLTLPGPEYEAIARVTYFDVLARCAWNETCFRNYRLGNRKSRQCRKCALADVFSDERRDEAYTVIDTVHSFYENLGIRGETGIEPVTLFKERLIHTTTIGTVHNHSRTLPSGFFDPNDRSFLCGGTLLDMLLKDLAAEPLQGGNV